MFDPWTLVLAIAVVFFAALVQGSLGFGLAVTAAPLLAIIDPGFVPVVPQIISLPVALAAVARERAGLDLSGVGWIIAGRIPGSILAAWVLTIVVARTLDLLIGSIVLFAVVLLASGFSIPMTRSTRLAAGLVAGFSGTSSSIGGPPIALLYRNETGPTVRATMGLILGIGLTINLTVLTVAGLVDRDDLLAALAIGPAAAAGFWLSSRVKAKMEGPALRRGIFAVATLAAVVLLARAVRG